MKGNSSTIVSPPWKIGSKQIEIKYTPNNYNGWGICRCYDANNVRNFSQSDANAFALHAESKLRTQGEECEV